ncbi:hypothetical protein SAMN05421736_101713 [Evansella caseinilytica]|uniref:Uncharacterized protein n=1 Tax=Evansella caseinilytica TaxID=1503961 RepID=A0A1H3I506_9BACI|nr:hypothetical protein [Evansella caseinilytica]SDY22525.1 hypothetical protein SAMN05421736_101713 [Evansella caseinilytica]
MNKKVLSGIVTVVILAVAGYYFFQNISGKTDLMMTYIDETNYLTEDYNNILSEEEMIASDEELFLFTVEVVIPELERLVKETQDYGKSISNEDLKEVHALHVQAMELRLQADEAWVNEEDAYELYEESDRLYDEYEKDLQRLASKWGVKIEWEQ